MNSLIASIQINTGLICSAVLSNKVKFAFDTALFVFDSNIVSGLLLIGFFSKPSSIVPWRVSYAPALRQR